MHETLSKEHGITFAYTTFRDLVGDQRKDIEDSVGRTWSTARGLYCEIAATAEGGKEQARATTTAARVVPAGADFRTIPRPVIQLF